METPTPHPLPTYDPKPGYDYGDWLTAAWLDR